MRDISWSVSVLSFGALLLSACGGLTEPDDPFRSGSKGAPDFVSEEPAYGPAYPGGGADAGAAASMDAGGVTATTSAPVPGGRVAEVEEADIYRISGNYLFYLNTYRGFLVFDISDPKLPRQVSRLPVFGYPTEMYVSGDTVYALLRDALYLTQVGGKPQFERHNVSQLVAIDITDVANPVVVKTTDIIGQLREGVSRKIEDTIYVVSYIPQYYYYYGWGYTQPTTPSKEQAWVYSYDVSDPKNPRKVNELQIFEGGSIRYSDSNQSYSKYFSGVAISATSNALMVVENWRVYSTSASDSSRCGSFESSQRAVVSIIDVSDPRGTIRRHTRFETTGAVGDQFKMTYVYDEAAGTGIIYIILARQVWSSSGCTGTSFTQNSIESWDITDGTHPVRLHRLDFGKPNETVRGTAFDVSRKVAYAITAQRIDPLYAISIADPRDLKILSAVDGLSGDMSVFRLISDGSYLLAVGTDTSAACTGFDPTNSRQATRIAVSIIDVRDLAKVRLVQRQCVSVEGATWGTSSDITWDLDQAHKMIGMFSDARANVITVPVSYYTQSDSTDWWYYQYQTAVGIMGWDLSRYDETKDETQQTVLTNYGTFIHPNGSVTRTIVYAHPVTGRRSMLNLSDTHASLADIEDLAHPTLQSTIEIAPYYGEIYRFGDYLVEHVTPKSYSYQEPHEFRVHSTEGGLSTTPLATFVAGQVQSVVKQGSNLVLLGYLPVMDGGGTSYRDTALIYDLSNPLAPRRAGQVTFPEDTMLSPISHYYYCGWAPWAGYYWNATNMWTATQQGLVMLSETYDYSNEAFRVATNLVGLDLSNPDQPRVIKQPISVTNIDDYYYNSASSLVADPVEPSSFFLATRTPLGNVMHGDTLFTKYRNDAQHWQFTAAGLQPTESINLPGALASTWAGADGQRLFLTNDTTYASSTDADGWTSYQPTTKLVLLRQISRADRIQAQVLDAKAFPDRSPSALVRDGNTLVLTTQGTAGYDYSPSTSEPTWEQTSDRLVVLDLSQNLLATAYDEPTGAYNLDIMGMQKGRAFLNLAGDGIVVLDVSSPAAPIGVSFLRTLGYATHLASFDDDIYVASGYFGIEHVSLLDPPNL